MRQRLFAAVASLGLLSAIVGCHHTAGCCDCEYDGYGCCAGCGGTGGHYGGMPSDPHVISSAPMPAPVVTPVAPPLTKPTDTDKPVDKAPAPKSDDTPNKE